MTVELPIFNDNLKSSGSWTSIAAATKTAWAQADTAPIRAAQIKHLAQRAAIHDDAGLRAAAELVSAWAKETPATFEPARLLTLHRTLTGADTLRQTEPKPINTVHDPTPAVLLPRFLDNAFDWFSTEGFAEMHAVEQAAVVYLRLMDLHPFDALNETTALLAASFYVERAGLPPLFVYSDDITARRFEQVTETGMRMLTQPLVEFFVEMLQRTMTEAAQ